MMLPVRCSLIAIALLLATAAYIHAASETGRAIVPPGFLGRSGIDANVVSKLVDGSVRAEAMALEAEAAAAEADIDPDEIAALAADPSELERLIEVRRSSAARSPMDMFSHISSQSLKLARLSYSIDPLNAGTLRTLALGHALAADPGRTRLIMRLASSLSKRDDITNLWLAQDYGRQGDVRRMLASFDHVLRTSRRARQGVMGVLVSTLGSEESHAYLGKLLQQEPEWQYTFWSEFARNPVALSNASIFFKNSGIPIEQMPEDRRHALYANLKRAGQYEVLFELVSLESDARSGRTHRESGGFAVANPENPLSWKLNSQGNFAARVHGPSGELYIDARAGSFGTAAERIMRGSNDFEIFVRMGEAVPSETRVRLTAICVAGQQRELTAVNLVSGDQEGHSFVSAQDCAVIRLEISFEVAQGRYNPLIRIAEVELSEQ